MNVQDFLVFTETIVATLFLTRTVDKILEKKFLKNSYSLKD